MWVGLAVVATVISSAGTTPPELPHSFPELEELSVTADDIGDEWVSDVPIESDYFDPMFNASFMVSDCLDIDTSEVDGASELSSGEVPAAIASFADAEDGIFVES